MKIYFNNLGVVTSVDTTGDSLRQGSVGVELEAHFDDVDNSEYTATLNFTRSDGISISGLIMALDQSDSEVYNYKFMDPWFFAKAGTTTLSIYLRATDGTIKAQGQVTFSIEATDYDEEPTMTVSQYNELVAAIQETNEAIEEKSTVSGTVENEHLVSLTIDGVTYRIASGGTTYVAGTGITINPNTDVIAVDTSWLNEQYASKSSVESIESLIPAQASSNNKLADRDFVNSSIATQTSNFLGTFNVVTDLGLTTSATKQQIASAIATKLASLGTTPTNNDYVYVGYPNATVSTQYDQFDRYKFKSSVSSWEYEYTLNNSSFTAEQWAAIQSGITTAKVSAYDSHLLDTNNPHSVTKAQIGLGNVENYGRDTIVTEGSDNYITSGAVYIAVNTRIPKSVFTAKGQLLVGNGSGAYSVLGIGSRGMVLTVGANDTLSYAIPTFAKLAGLEGPGDSTIISEELALQISKKGLIMNGAAVTAGSQTVNGSPWPALFPNENNRNLNICFYPGKELVVRTTGVTTFTTGVEGLCTVGAKVYQYVFTRRTSGTFPNIEYLDTFACTVTLKQDWSN